MPNPVLHQDLGTQQVHDIAVRLRQNVEKTQPYFAKFFSKAKWPEAKESITYRVLVHETLPKEQMRHFELKEYIAPDPIGLTYAQFSMGAANYGTYIEYTREDVYGNADQIVPDIKDRLLSWTYDKLDTAYSDALLKSKSTLKEITAGEKGQNKLLLASEKARHFFIRYGCRPLPGGRYKAIAPIEVLDAFAKEYLDVYGSQMPRDDNKKTIENYSGTYLNMDFEYPDDQYANVCLTDTDEDGTINGYYMLFIANDSNGKTAAISHEGSKEQFIETNLKPLGSGLVKDGKTGQYVPDYNNQVGAVSVNINKFAPVLIDDRAVIVLYVEAGYVGDIHEGDTYAKTDKEMYEKKESTTGAYFETHKDADTVVESAPLTLSGPATVAKLASINLIANRKVASAESSATGTATVALQGDKTTIKVTGVAAGTVTVTAKDPNGLNEAKFTVTVTGE